jgi:hypothetical protein
MRWKRAAALLAIGASCAVGAASASPAAPTPKGWRLESAPSVGGAGTYSVALPPAMRTVPVIGTRSYVAEYRSETLTLLFDFGAHPGSAPPTCRRKLRCTIRSLGVHGSRATRLFSYQRDPDGGLPDRIAYEIAFGTRPGRITLAIQAECANASACALADRIVKTIEIRPDR